VSAAAGECGGYEARDESDMMPSQRSLRATAIPTAARTERNSLIMCTLPAYASNLRSATR
jgi:hypothetical protein